MIAIAKVNGLVVTDMPVSFFTNVIERTTPKKELKKNSITWYINTFRYARTDTVHLNFPVTPCSLKNTDSNMSQKCVALLSWLYMWYQLHHDLKGYERSWEFDGHSCV